MELSRHWATFGRVGSVAYMFRFSGERFLTDSRVQVQQAGEYREGARITQ
jgi:hypothetical protein